MMKIILLGFLFFTFSECFGQTNSKCDCDGLVEPFYMKPILLLDKPNGHIKNSFTQDTAKQDFLVFTIDNDSLDYFHLKLIYPFSKRADSGWTKKSKYLGVYARNYAPRDTLFLYSKADIKSKLSSFIPSWTNQLYQIVKCNNKWVYVKIEINGTIKEGWLRPEMQCSNPYTTCN